MSAAPHVPTAPQFAGPLVRHAPDPAVKEGHGPAIAYGVPVMPHPAMYPAPRKRRPKSSKRLLAERAMHKARRSVHAAHRHAHRIASAASKQRNIVRAIVIVILAALLALNAYYKFIPPSVAYFVSLLILCGMLFQCLSHRPPTHPAHR